MVPVFISICLGAIIRRSGIVPEETFPRISKIAFTFLLPFTLFKSIYTSDFETAFDGALIGYVAGFVVVWFLLGYALCSKLVKDYRQRGAFIQSVFRANTAVVGLSMAEALMGADGVAVMSIVMAFSVPLFNVLAVITLETCREGAVHLKPTLIGIAKNPLIIGCAAGAAFLLLKIELPSPVMKAVNDIGNAGSVMTLVALGASFKFSGVKANFKKIVIANVVRLILAPLAAVTGAALLGFRGIPVGVVLLLTAPSLAATAYTMAIARDSDHELTGQIVVTTSFFCCVTIFVWILLLKRLGLL